MFLGMLHFVILTLSCQAQKKNRQIFEKMALPQLPPTLAEGSFTIVARP
jgi:hypothetical protein